METVPYGIVDFEMNMLMNYVFWVSGTRGADNLLFSKQIQWWKRVIIQWHWKLDDIQRVGSMGRAQSCLDGTSFSCVILIECK